MTNLNRVISTSRKEDVRGWLGEREVRGRFDSLRWFGQLNDCFRGQDLRLVARIQEVCR